MVWRHTYPFNGLFSRTTWVSRYQKGKTRFGLNEARDDGVWGWQWHQLDHMQTICAPHSRQITTPTPRHSIFTGRMLFLTPNRVKALTQTVWYGSSVDNTVEENSSVFSLIRICWLPSTTACEQQNFAPTKSSSS